MKGNARKHYIQPSFLICIAVLAIGGSAMSMIKSYLGVRMIKKALPLRKSLDFINEKVLAPYTVIEKRKIENQDVLEILGTEDYIQWVLENTEVESSSPLRYCSLFVTYYTGNPDRVPHVPEECFFGAGNQRFGTEDITFVVNVATAKTEAGHKADEKAQGQRIPARCLIFGKKDADLLQDSSKFPVFYSFVEWQFYNTVFDRRINPKKEDAIKASEQLLGVVLPILERDHWPDWQEAMQEG